MSKAQAKDQPSVEELLASIREAIYEDGEGPNGAGMTAARHKAPPAHKQEERGVAPARPLAASAASRPGSRPERPHDGGGMGDLVARGSMRGMRVSLDHDIGGSGRVSTRTDDFLHLHQRITSLAEEGRGDAAKRTMVTSSPEGFTGILGGDVRLEEALARLSRAGRQPRSEEIARPPAPPTPPTPPPPRPLDAATLEQLAGHELRPGIRDVVDAELQTLPRASGRSAPVHAPVEPEPSAHAEPVDDQTYGYAASATDDAPAPAAWNDGSAAGQQAWAAPASYAGARVGDAGHVSGSEAPPPGHDGWQAAPSPPRGYAPPPGYPSPMLAPESADQASSAFNRLADTIMAQATGGERSIEDITRDLLRPMLKSWLDHNLPRVVERLVREEIERVARRGAR